MSKEEIALKLTEISVNADMKTKGDKEVDHREYVLDVYIWLYRELDMIFD